MVAVLKFFHSEIMLARGFGVKREKDDWKYFLPFSTKDSECEHRDFNTHFVLALNERLIVAAQRTGRLVLIDLDQGGVIARAGVGYALSDLQLSADGRHLFAQDKFKLCVLDAATLGIVQSWSIIERSGDSWIQYAGGDAQDIFQKKFDDNVLSRLHITRPVIQIADDKLAATSAFDPQKRSWFNEQRGTYVLDIPTGAIEHHADAKAAFRLRRGIYASALPILAQTASAQSSPTSCPAFEEFVAREIVTTITATGRHHEAAIAAIMDLAARMERDLDALIRCDQIAVRFDLNGQVVAADAFFDRILREGWYEAVPALRRLLMAYLQGIGGGEGGMPWHYDGQSLSALRALVLLDPDQHDVYRLYLDKGDLEHDHGPYKLYAEYVHRHSIRNEADVRFGFYVTLKGFSDTDARPGDLLNGAARLMTPERFAAIVIEEAEQHAELWDMGDDYLALLSTFAETAYVRTVVDILERSCAD